MAHTWSLVSVRLKRCIKNVRTAGADEISSFRSSASTRCSKFSPRNGPTYLPRASRPLVPAPSTVASTAQSPMSGDSGGT
eukprot:scaffold46171_cov29-Tisochrysis_lutea.AAC.10